MFLGKLARFALVFICSGFALATAADWPQWRGPDRTDVSPETGLLTSWPPGGPRRVWLFTDAGVGYSGPAIVGDRLFLMGGRNGREQLFALDVESGAELWAADMGGILSNNWGDGPRGTPTVDGDYVYALGGEGNLVCAKADDGSVVWQVAMQDFGGKTPGWGYTESALVDGSKVVCTPGGDDGSLLALDKATGRVIWQSEDFTEGAQYSSIMAANINGTRQYVQLFQKTLVGIDAETGRLLWSSDWPGRTAVVPTPIPRDNFVYVTSGYGAGCKLVEISGANNRVEEVYDNKEMKNHHGGVVLVGDHLFGYSDRVGWLCQDFMTGAKVWSDRDALGKGAVTYADGHYYCLEERSGTVALIAASIEGWQEKGRFKLTPQTEIRKSSGKIWTHPVIANGRMYLRDQDLVYCYDVGAKSED